MKRFLCQAITCALLVAMLLSLGNISVVAEDAVESFPDVSKASAVYFYHMESGRLMGAENETAELPAGTTVRLLSGLIFCERLKDRLSQYVSIESYMIRETEGYFGYGLEAGEVYTVEQLLYLSVCGGCNDAFYVLASVLGDGNIQTFVDDMNRRAEDIGATRTIVTDPSGILDSSTTTAFDLFEIAKVTVENSLYMAISGSVFYDVSANRRIENRNALISSAQEKGKYYNGYCRGLCAGKTDRGGWSVVTLSENGNDRYLCVVLGGAEGENSEKYGYVIANRLIQWGYDNYCYLEVLNPDVLICTIPVEVSDLADSVEVKAAESVFFYLPAGATEDVQLNIRLLYETLEAPVTSGTHVGYVAIIYQGEILGTAALYTVEDVPRSEFVGGLTRIRKLTESRAARAGLVFFTVALVGWILTEYFIKRAKHRKWDRYFSEKIDTSETFLTKR